MQWLAEVCVHRPVFATVIILFLTVVGGFSFFTLGVDRFPKIDLPTITVRTTNPGASPQEIETEITDVIEAAVNTVPGIEELRSTSSRGVSNVTITFNLEKDSDQAFQEVQQKVSSVTNRLPQNADPPIVQKSDPDSQPILQYSISAPRDIVELTTLVEDLIQERIESADGVGEVFFFGARRKQVKILINPEKLRSYNLSVTDVTNAVRAQNQELPGGSLIEGAKTFGLRTMSKLTSVEEFNDIVITNRNGFPVRIKDIGRVEAGGAEPTTAASLNGVQSVSIGIRKQPGSNTIAVINNVKARMAEIIPTLPPDMKVAIIRDQSEFIQNSLSAIEEHLIIGGILASIVVFLFLWNLRSTIIAALAIPVSIIASFAVIAAFGYSLNQMTMLALTLMVGIVIDDAIVVLENIYRFVEEKGMSPFQAAIEGTREIGFAVLATTLSLLAVFIPVGFMTGIVGRFMSSFGLTSAAAIVVSLIVSFTLTPMLAARWIKPKQEESSHKESKESWFYKRLDTFYTRLLHFSLSHRWLIVLICILTVASTYPLYRYVGMSFLPEEDESLYQVNLRAPEGTSLAATQSILERIARDIREQIPGVESTLVLAGFGRGSGPNNGFINVRLKPVNEREFSQNELIQKTRALVRKYQSKEYQISVSAPSSIAGSLGLGRGGTGVAYYITGPDMEQLANYANLLVEKMKEDPIFRDPDASIEKGSPEVRVLIDRQKAADLGVKAGDVAQALNILSAGARVSSFNQNNDLYDVVVQADEPFRRDRSNLKLFTVASANGNPVELEKLVKLEEGVSPASINRLNRQRQVTISAGLPPNASEADALKKIEQYVKELNLPPSYRTGVAGQSKELQKAYDAFMLAFLLSFVFMYLVLAAQFESFIHPVTILLTLPIAVPFALLSTALAGQTLNIFSALGILLLFGIVKKNAILQIDHTNNLREKGMSRYEAIIQANRDRLRPILMTTISLVAGMIPLTLGSGAGAATNRSIGILVVGGQSLCLLLTLLAVPVFYSIFDDIQQSTVWQRIATHFAFMGRILKPIGSKLADLFTLFSKRRSEENKYVD
ncbi:MAG: efflux RND transporter permease subunit [Pyrinomonadaceae bacterium]|nr:efflux RND transporter permease subunit [Pyrinomonadaceae bacterium]MCX7640724.1 efflux RND transporter permease subunit [Pyrinomonadaceae bacterium]MDW8305308.1 efflux RND transporter permease subunit [Acidobacteriota bacterium]